MIKRFSYDRKNLVCVDSDQHMTYDDIFIHHNDRIFSLLRDKKRKSKLIYFDIDVSDIYTTKVDLTQEIKQSYITNFKIKYKDLQFNCLHIPSELVNFKIISETIDKGKLNYTNTIKYSYSFIDINNVEHNYTSEKKLIGNTSLGDKYDEFIILCDNYDIDISDVDKYLQMIQSEEYSKLLASIQRFEKLKKLI